LLPANIIVDRATLFWQRKFMHKLHPLRASFEQRFWKYVQKTDGCWLWTGFRDVNGYGHLRIGRYQEGQVTAQRASWIVHFGPIPDGLYVLHKCDVPWCVRPDHLYLGTQKQNLQDMAARGRHWLQGRGHLVAGDKGANARLTWPVVDAIREAHANGESRVSLARYYGVTPNNIGLIVRNRTWVRPS
jgi:HNH endonuclease